MDAGAWHTELGEDTFGVVPPIQSSLIMGLRAESLHLRAKLAQEFACSLYPG